MPSTLHTGHDALVLVDDTNGITVIPQLSELRRLNWFDGKLLRADDLRVEQDHMRGLVRRSNRAGGHGAIEGLTCTLGSDGLLHVSPGTAIDPSGRPLLLPVDVPLDVQELIERTAGALRPALAITKRRKHRDFDDCVEPEGGGQAQAGGGRWYVITVGWAEGLCGNEEVYGRLCEDACTTSTDRPWRQDGLVFRARAIQPHTPLATSVAVALGASHERSLLASALFADERSDAGSLISGDGLRSPIWCMGAAPGNPAFDEVPLGVIGRQGATTSLLDVWTARRERMEAPPRRYWAGRMALRPWNVFLAQVLQFQCQLADLLEDGPAPGGPGRPDPCAERQHALESAVAELERRPLQALAGAAAETDDILALLKSRMLSLRLTGEAVSRRVLVDGGIVELPPAGYLPVDPARPQSVEDQVRALVGAGLDLTFCTTRSDAVARALEDAQHLDRISLLRGLDDPKRREEVEIIVPDGEVQEVAARDAWHGELQIGKSAPGFTIPNAGDRLAGAGRVETAGELALRWAGGGPPAAAKTTLAASVGADVRRDTTAAAPGTAADDEADALAAVADEAAAEAAAAWEQTGDGGDGAIQEALAREAIALSAEQRALAAEEKAAETGGARDDAEARVAAAVTRTAEAQKNVVAAASAAAGGGAAAATRRGMAGQRSSVAAKRLAIAKSRVAAATSPEPTGAAAAPSGWLEATADRSPLTLGPGESTRFEVAGDMTVDGKQTRGTARRGSVRGKFTLERSEPRARGVRMTGSVSAVAEERTVLSDSGTSAESWVLDEVDAVIQSTVAADGGTTVTLQLSPAPGYLLMAALAWRDGGDTVEVAVRLADTDAAPAIRTAGTDVVAPAIRTAGTDVVAPHIRTGGTGATRTRVLPAASVATALKSVVVGDEVVRLTLEREPGAADAGHPSRASSEKAARALERALHDSGYAEAVLGRLFPSQDSAGIRLRATRDWVLFRRRAVLRCGTVVEAPVTTVSYAVYGVVGSPANRRPEPVHLGTLRFREGSAEFAGGAAEVLDAWGDIAAGTELVSAGVVAGSPGGDALALKRAERAAAALAGVSPPAGDLEPAVLPSDGGLDARGADGIFVVAAAPAEPAPPATIAARVLAVRLDVVGDYRGMVDHGQLDDALKALAGESSIDLGTVSFPEGSDALVDESEAQKAGKLFRDHFDTERFHRVDVFSTEEAASGGGEGLSAARGKAVEQHVGETQSDVRPHTVTEGMLEATGFAERVAIVVVPLRG